MSKKPKRDAPADERRPPAHWWLPSLVFLAVPFLEIAFSFPADDYVQEALWVHHRTLNALGLGAWALAGLLIAARPLRLLVVRHLDGLNGTDNRDRLWPPLAALGFSILACFIKFCQYRGFQLPLDTAAMAGMAFSTLHGRWFQVVPMATNALGIHFAFTVALLSPVLLLWRSALPLLFIQCLAIGSTGWAAYELAYILTSSSFAGFIAMLIAYSHPSFYQMISASLDSGLFAPALFLWGVVFFEKRMWKWCVLCLALAVTTKENFPLTLAGWGLYLPFRKGRPTLSGAAAGAAIFAGAVLLWFGEMKVVGSFGSLNEQYWSLYPQFGANKREVLSFILGHPFLAMARTVYPFSRLLPTAGLLAFCSLLPLAAPAQLLPFLAAAAPQIMVANDIARNYLLQYAPFTFGPMLFATAYGAAVILRRLQNPDRRWIVLATALAVSGLGWRSATRTLLDNWRVDWFRPVPALVAEVPKDASLWCDEYLSAWVACRLQLKTIPYNPDKGFSSMLFRPEYVAVHKSWFFQASPQVRDPVLSFLAQNRYGKIEDLADVVLLKDPQEPRPLSPWIDMPQTSQSPAQMKAYLDYLLRAPASSANIFPSSPAD